MATLKYKQIKKDNDLFTLQRFYKNKYFALFMNAYKFDGVVKELYCSNNKIALNLGSEVHFIDSNGWLIKKYSSAKEIRKIVITDDIAGIVYRDKIEIIKL